MVGAQQPAAYKVGFMGGCDSGHLSAGDTSYIFKKDTDRFETDDAYKRGWNDGFNRCASVGGVSSRSYSSQRYYPYYYPYYSPGYSLWMGYYGYLRHNRWHYVHRHNYYYAPWFSSHKHRSGGKGSRHY